MSRSVDDLGPYHDELAERRSEGLAHRADFDEDRPTSERDLWDDCVDCGIPTPPHAIRNDRCPECRRGRR